MSELSFTALQQQYAQRVDKILNAKLINLTNKQSLVEAMHYALLFGGKRLRPLLVYMTGTLLGATATDLDGAAAAVECMHAYSLIHDDLPAMDNDNLRRGQPTCHIKFGEAQAILAGDALQSLAFSILCDHPMPNVSIKQRLDMVSELANAVGAQGMCLGQSLDLVAEQHRINLAELELIHQYKTGALISASVKLGALTTGQTNIHTLTILETFSHTIGLLFQIQDDILDVTGNTATLGKQIGADQQRHKSTYPGLLGLSQAQQKARLLHEEALKALAILTEQGYDVSQLKALTNFIIERNN